MNHCCHPDDETGVEDNAAKHRAEADFLVAAQLETIVVAASGTVVPTATITAPMTNSPIPYRPGDSLGAGHDQVAGREEDHQTDQQYRDQPPAAPAVRFGRTSPRWRRALTTVRVSQMKNATINTAPSTREISPSTASAAVSTGVSSAALKSRRMLSRGTDREISTAKARTSATLTMFAPSTSPKAICGTPFSAALDAYGQFGAGRREGGDGGADDARGDPQPEGDAHRAPHEKLRAPAAQTIPTASIT